MTDISITRFLPTSPARDKVSSVQAGRGEEEHSRSFQERGDGQADQPVEDTGERVGERVVESQLEAAVARLNDYIQTVQRDIIFGIDLGAAEPSVTVVDRKSRKIVRQFGGKEALEMARKVEAQEPLTLFKAQV